MPFLKARLQEVSESEQKFRRRLIKMEMDNQQLKDERAEIKKHLDEKLTNNETSVKEEYEKIVKKLEEMVLERHALHRLVMETQKENDELKKELERANTEVTKGQEDKKQLEVQLAAKENDMEKLRVTNCQEFQDLESALIQAEEDKGALSEKCNRLEKVNRCVSTEVYSLASMYVRIVQVQYVHVQW